MTSQAETRRVIFLLKTADRLALVNHLSKLQTTQPDSDLIALIELELQRRQSDV